MLTFVDQVPLFHSVNLGPIPHIEGNMLSPRGIENATAYQTRVDVFLCPSDPMVGGFPDGPVSYRYNVAMSYPYVHFNEPGRVGAFQVVTELRDADFKDGLSQTAGMSERLLGGGSEVRFDPVRDFWTAGTLGLSDDTSDDSLLRVCRARTVTPGDFFGKMGFSWMTGAADTIWYNHVAPPNERSTDCALSSSISGSTPDDASYYTIAARSAHGGGVNVVMMDGSVRFVKDGIALATWRALGTRSGGEAVGDGW
jgi:prepilin-type processing-associated H-X9-DG protein